MLSTVGEPALYTAGAPALSPDGKRAAVAEVDAQTGTIDIWLIDFARGVSSRFTFDPAAEAFPVRSPDGSRIAYGSNRGGHMDWYQRSSDGASDEQLLFKSDDDKLPISWSRDGRFLLGYSMTSFSDLWVLPLDSHAASMQTRRTFSFLHSQSEFRTRGRRFSPDGRWVSYVSNESGKAEIYVRPFDASAPDAPASGGKWMVSKDGGDGAHWGGKELFYLSTRDGSVVAVDVATTPVFQAGVPKVLFKTKPGWQFWDVSSDGQRFLIPVPVMSTLTSYKVVAELDLDAQTVGLTAPPITLK